MILDDIEHHLRVLLNFCFQPAAHISSMNGAEIGLGLHQTTYV